MASTTRLIQLLLVLLTLGGLICASACGQGGTIVGTVRTRDGGHPIAGAQVRLLGTTLSDVTGDDGHYRIASAPPGERAVLVVSGGHVPATVLVTVPSHDSVSLGVELLRAAQATSSSLALTTGDHDRVTLDGVVARIDAESLVRNAPVQTFAELLTARAPGVLVLPSSGTAGTGSQITMRGVANPYVSIAPLVLVDGIRVDANPRAFTIDVGGQAPSRLDDLDPATLRSIDILRGPAAAALYGAEATNGVILVTTRQGTPGPIRTHAFTAQGFASEAGRFPDNVQAVTAAGAACPLDAQGDGSCSAQRILRSNPLQDGPASPIASGSVRTYGLEAAGSTRNVRFAVGADLHSDAGIYRLPDSEAQRLVANYGTGALRDHVVDPNYLRRASVYTTASISPSTRFDFAAAVRYMSSVLRLPLNDNAEAGLLVNGLLGAPDSTPGGQWWKFRPGEIFQFTSTQDIDRLMGSVSARFRPSGFLELRSVLGGEALRQHDGHLQRAGEGPSTAGPSPGLVSDNWARTKHLTAILSASAAERFGGAITGRTTLGVEYSRVRGDTLLQDGSGLAPGATAVSQADSQSSYWTSGRTRNVGYLLQQELSRAGRLFVGGAIRWDHVDESATPPSAVWDMAGWVSWLVPLRGSGALESLRIRGATGSVARRSPYRLPTPLAPTVGSTPPPTPQRPDPERTAESGLGADAEFFRGRLGVGATVYARRTRGFVTFILTPPSSGFSYQLLNGGDIVNQGVELELTAEPVRSERATLSVHLGAWGNQNRVLRVTTFLVPVGFQQRVFQGYPVGTYYTLAIAGFKDANGDGVLTSKELMLGDLVPSGSPLPTQGATANAALTWRRWLRLSGTLEYRGGGSQVNLTAASRCQVMVCSARSVPGTPLAEQAQALADGLGLEGRPLDAGFIKLREVSLTLTAPAPWAARLGASALRLTLAGRNLATWTPYSGLDPEVNAVGQLGVPKMDSFTQPLVRYLTARLDVEY